jgi:predicted double-glycine peptidase
MHSQTNVEIKPAAASNPVCRPATDFMPQSAPVTEALNVSYGMSGILRWGLTILGVLWSCAAGAARLQSQVIVEAGSARMEMRVTSLRERRDAGVIKQHYDYSCGSAALATLLTYGLQDRVDEEALLQALLLPLSPEEVVSLQSKGLSLLDLQRLAQGRGHTAQGYRIAQNQLARISRPVIVFIKPHGYQHFAVFKGLRGDRVYLADPSLGNVRMPLYRFLDMWADKSGRGVIFAVERGSGDWPDHFALQLSGASDAAPEVLNALRLSEIAKSYPIMSPNK